jgi:peroxiredoxin
LKAYNESRNEFEEFKAQLVAITPEIPDSSLSTKERDSLVFRVLSDVGNKVAEQFGIVYTLPAPVAEMLGELVAAYNADSSARLPLAVTYVIDTSRVIRYAFVDSDYKKRAEPQEIVAALKKL